MTFSEIASGTRLYIDANVFVYHFAHESDECAALLERCDRREINAYTGTHILLEVAHRIMTIEAVDKGLVTPGNVPRKLKRRPEVVSQLQDHSAAIRYILEMNIEILRIDAEILGISADLRAQTGFLVNDSVSLAMMRRESISAIATNDRDFQRVAGLEVHIPDDL